MLIKNFVQLGETSERKAVLEIVEAGLGAIQPAKVLADWVLPEGNYNRVFLVGFGKGSAAVSKILEQKLGEKLTGGWVIDVSPEELEKIKLTLGTHPLPSMANVSFTRDVLSKLANLSKKDLVLVVVCGGGSALFTDPTVPLPVLIRMNQELLKSGKTIIEMNNERKKIDRVKGGGLAKLLSPAKVVGLIFSDVPGNDIATIASGPTAAPNAENILVLSNLIALSAMKEKVEELGYETEIYSDRVQGEACTVGMELVDVVVRQQVGKKVLLAGGETTVTVKGNGRGGRNQELVLAAVESLSGTSLSNITVASVGTDGWDNTPVAGAMGDQTTIVKANSLGLTPEEFLRNNNSYNFFQKVGDCIDTGRLPMNVADLMVVLKS